MKTFLEAEEDPEDLSPNGRIEVNMQDLKKLDQLLDIPEDPTITDLKKQEEKPLNIKLDQKQSMELYEQLNLA